MLYNLALNANQENKGTRSMNGSINFSSYFNAITCSYLTLSGETLTENIKSSLKFHYGKVGYQEYSEKHDFTKEWAHKVTAIPLALYSGTIKTTYHLAKAIFIGIPSSYLEKNNALKLTALKTNSYAFIRDLEESFGQILTIFSDKMGSYLVQKSLFQKECYSIFEHHAKTDVKPETPLKNSYNFSCYLATVLSEKSSISEENLAEAISQEHLQLRYQNASYQTYESHHKFEGFFDRKIIAIPNALYSGIVKTTYHLASAIFLGIPLECYELANQILFKNDPNLQRHFTFSINMYKAGRDFEESVGWITTLFHDKAGSYLVQESLFQKECYSIYQAQTRIKISTNSDHKESEFFLDKPEQSSSPVNKKPAFSILSHVVKSTQKFFAPKDPPINYNLLSNLEFSQLTLNSLSEACPNQLNTIRKRLKAQKNAEEAAILASSHIRESNPPQEPVVDNTDEEFIEKSNKEPSSTNSNLVDCNSEEIAAEEPSQKNTSQTLLVQFQKIPGKEIDRIIEEIPPKAFSLLTQEQIKEMTFLNASDEQIENLFNDPDDSTGEDLFKVTSLSTQQLQAVLNKLERRQLIDIPDETLPALNIVDLSEQRIRFLFTGIPEVTQKRLSKIKLKQLQDILYKLHGWQLYAISKETLPKLKINHLSHLQVVDLLNRREHVEEADKRLASLNSEQIISIQEHLDLSPKLKRKSIELLVERRKLLTLPKGFKKPR